MVGAVERRVLTRGRGVGKECVDPRWEGGRWPAVGAVGRRNDIPSLGP